MSMDVLFVGCSLSSELDVLMSAGMRLEDKARNDPDHRIVFVSYGDDCELIKLRKYGITDVICVNGDSINVLYADVHKISDEKDVLKSADKLDEYADIRINKLANDDERNIDYLFMPSTRIGAGEISIPSFFTERSVGNDLIKRIKNEKYPLYIIYGRHFSGKSYVLLQLLMAIKDRKVYYFDDTVKLGNEVLVDLVHYRDCVFLIDDGVISTYQFDEYISANIEEFSKNNVRFIMSVNSGDEEFYKYTKRIG